MDRGAMGEIQRIIAFLMSPYIDNNEFYSDSDFQNNIEIRNKIKNPYNFLLIRPGEMQGKYFLIIKDNDKDYNFTIKGWFLYKDDLPPT